MSDVAFHTAPQIGGLSCLNSDNCQPEVVSDVISGLAFQFADMDVIASFGDSRLKPLEASSSAVFRTSITTDRK